MSNANEHPDRELISAYLDEELSPAEVVVLGEHLQACPACARLVDEFMVVKGLLLRSEPFWLQSRPAVDFSARLMARIAVMPLPATSQARIIPGPWWRPTPSLLRPLLAAAAALLILVGGVLFLGRGRSSYLYPSHGNGAGSLVVASNTQSDYDSQYLREHGLSTSDGLLLDGQDTVEFVEYAQH